MKKDFSIYYTSDTHGHIFPTNYATGRSEASGLLNISARIQKDGNTWCWTAEILFRERLLPVIT